MSDNVKMNGRNLNLDDYKDIFVVCEQVDGEVAKVGIELLGESKKLAADLGEKVVAVIVGEKVKDRAQLLIESGADKVIYIEDPMLKDYVTEPYTKAIVELVKAKEPNIVMFGATSIGRDMAPRIASRLHTGLTADCTKLDIDPEAKLRMMTRPAFGGDVMATIKIEEFRPQMATVRPGVMQPLEREKGKQGEVEEFKVEFVPEDMNVTIKEVVKNKDKAEDVTEAKVLISGGRGIGYPEFFQELQKVADEFEGGMISSSRANVDAGWIEKARQVGQTGKTVRPDLYMANGISGAIQHLAGMENSEYIIAINKSEAAAIHEVADLGIVGDVHKIIPKLQEALVKYKEEHAVQE